MAKASAASAWASPCRSFFVNEGLHTAVQLAGALVNLLFHIHDDRLLAPAKGC